MFNNKSIFITGGTGSFGKEFIKVILKKFKPKKLVIFSRDELKQHEMSIDPFFSKYKSIRFFLGDVRDIDRLVTATKNIDFLVHAAALKQVPAAEYNPMEAIKTNILGAENVIKASIENKIKKIVCLSTDKAVNPINLYGATKLASDKLFIAANNITGNQKTLFSVVRYGNVAGSRGSVLPVFKKIIDSGEKYFPITHKDMTRFWLTLEDGVNFVIKSFQKMSGGEIFIPKLPAVKIVSLAQSMSKKLKIRYTGVRSGEKIHELLFSSDDSKNILEFKDYFILLPDIKFFSQKNYYDKKFIQKKTKIKEYSSGTSNLLKINEIKALNKKIGF